MAIDATYKNQLKAFGVEFTQAEDDNLTKKLRQEFAATQADVIKNLMSTMQGRQWVNRKLSSYGTFYSPFVAGKPDATQFLVGRQSAGIELFGEIMVDAPDMIDIMIQEEEARSVALKSRIKQRDSVKQED